MRTKQPGPSRAAHDAQLQRDVEALHVVQASRPLKAPPMRLLPPVITAAMLELRQARKMGHAA